MAAEQQSRHITVLDKPHFDPKLFLARVGAGKTRVELRRRQIVFSQGDPADAVFYIEKGRIELRVLSQQGKEAVLASLGLGDFFGEACLAGQPLRVATAVSAAESSVVRLDKSAMLAVLRDEPVFSALFISYLLNRNLRIEEDLADHLLASSEQRLARLLLRLANFGAQGTPEAVIPKISQETLAQMIGTTRSRVSFFMNKFRRLGFIECRGSLSVHSSLRNVVLHD